jgi:hypothetical protein
MEDLVGQFARLPNQERVFIESVSVDGDLRRIEGEREGTRAICLVSGLEMSEGEIAVQELG